MSYFDWLTVLSLFLVLFCILCLSRVEEIISEIQKDLRDKGKKGKDD